MFLALPLPDAVRSALAVQQVLLPLPRRVDPQDLHLTLVFLGDTPEVALEEAHDGFAGLRAPAMTLALQGLGLFGGTRPRAAWAGVAPSEPLIRLQARADRLARLAGCAVESRRFVTHVTLGRFSVPPPPQALRRERAIAMTSFATPPFEVTEMVPVQSTLTPRGARHDRLAHYPLG